MLFDTIRLFCEVMQNLKHLKTNIRQIMVEIPPNMCQKVIENNLKRINPCNILHGGHLNDVVFPT